MAFGKRDAALLIPFFVFLILLLPLKEGFTDDGFIHIQYARNIIERGEYSFNPGTVSFGTTSPLWVLLQAALGKIFGGAAVLVATSRIASWTSGFLAILVLFLFARKLAGDRLIAFLSALVFSADAWFVRWTAMSMETASAVFVMACVGLASIDGYTNRRSALMLGFFMGVAALVRPEAYLFMPIFVLALFLQGGRVDNRCAAATIGMFLAVVVPWLLFARLHIGSFLPNTAGAKSGGIVTNPLVFVEKFAPIVKIIGSTQGIWGLFILLSLVASRRSSVILSRPLRFVVLCVVSLPVTYVIFDMQVLSRYLLLVTPFIAVMGVLACSEVLRRWALPDRSRRLALVIVSITAVVVSAGFYVIAVVPPSRAFSRDLTHELKDLAVYLKDHSAEDDVVAAADIGYLAFYSDRKVLDLGGLVEPATGVLRKQYTYEEIVDRGLYLALPGYPHVDFFIDRVHEPRRFDGAVLKHHRFEAILVKMVDNLGIRKPGPYYYTLYRLDDLGGIQAASALSNP